MTKHGIDEITFLMACLKHSPVKPDFDAVGNELGITKRTAYHRHYNMAKKWTAAADEDDAATPATPSPASPKASTPAKRGRKAQTDATQKAIVDEDDDANVPVKPAKKQKIEKNQNARDVDNDPDAVEEADAE